MMPHTAVSPPSSSEPAALEPVPPIIVITGNPNVGKSVLFQRLTGRYATVSNYPGTTVMLTWGALSLDGSTAQVCDAPGLNSLHAASEDELVARDVLLRDHAVVIQVGDAKNLARAVMLALELAEAELPSVLVLNMIDEARERRLTIDVAALSGRLGIPVVPTIATQGVGIDRVRRAIPQACRARAAVRYPAVIEEAVERIGHVLPPAIRAKRAIALLWLAGDAAIAATLRETVDAAALAELGRIADNVRRATPMPLALVIHQARLRDARQLARQVTTSAPTPRRGNWTVQAGQLAMHPVWGVPILCAVLAAVYWLVGDVAAQRGVEFLEATVFGAYLLPAARWIVDRAVPWTLPHDLLVGEYGILTMAVPYAFAIILPIVGMFFFCFGFIEDVGYLPRLAVMANRACRVLGLNGKAVLPLVLGLGCGTMATMTARILETKRDRLLVTLLLALGVPCSAQLGVVMAMLAGLPWPATALWAGVVLGVLVLVGRIAATLIPGETTLFLYDIPPLRWPKLSNVAIKTLSRLEWYVKEAVPLFLLGTMMLFVLDAAGALARLERLAAPLVVGWLGLPAQATQALLVGFLRRDFGAAGFYALQREGALSHVQLVVSLITITLFLPCVAQYFMMVKERGWKAATAIGGVVIAVALIVGGVTLRVLGVAGGV